MRPLFRFLAVAAIVMSQSSHAQPWPTRPITILNGFPAGGNPDTALRHIASKLEARLGQPIVVENRTGAAGTIAASAASRAPADGHTLLFGVAANLGSGPASMKQPPYDPVKAFTPIIEVARGPYVVLVRQDSPAATFADLVARAKAQPGKLNFSSPGQGSVHHLTFEKLRHAFAIDVVHVPYRGGQFAALLAGDVHVMLDTMPAPLPLIQSKKIRALAVTGSRRLPGLPDVPALAELGAPDVDSSFWWGFVGPPGLPPAIVDRLNREIRQVLDDPAVASTFASWQIERTGGTPDAFAATIAGDYHRWREYVAKSGLAAD